MMSSFTLRQLLESYPSNGGEARRVFQPRKATGLELIGRTRDPVRSAEAMRGAGLILNLEPTDAQTAPGLMSAV